DLVADETGDGGVGFVSGVQACSLGSCVYDSNCRSLRAWSADGKLVGAGDLNALWGVTYSWPEKLVVTKDAAWGTWSHVASGSGDKLPHYGFIARMTGPDASGAGAAPVAVASAEASAAPSASA